VDVVIGTLVVPEDALLRLQRLEQSKESSDFAANLLVGRLVILEYQAGTHDDDDGTRGNGTRKDAKRNNGCN
jgi:hypothetical protein